MIGIDWHYFIVFGSQSKLRYHLLPFTQQVVINIPLNVVDDREDFSLWQVEPSDIQVKLFEEIQLFHDARTDRNLSQLK